MYSTSDTIVAIATPPGRGAIGVVRLSGPDAQAITCGLIDRSRPLTPRHATFAVMVAGVQRDEVVVTAYPAPRSYTGDDVVEIAAHGSTVILKAIVGAAMERGARLANPGEFTLRAYLNGRLDLPQAEAVADLIDAVTPLQARVAFDQLSGTLTHRIGEMHSRLFDLMARLEASVDFPEEGYHFVEAQAVAQALEELVGHVDGLLRDGHRGRLVRDGAQVTIVGRPNVGKSSLFNALVGAHRAIVTELPGTTRDLLTELVDLGGVRVTLTDTAGVRPSEDPIEREGVARARGAVGVSDLILFVADGSRPWTEEDQLLLDEVSHRPVMVVLNKADEPASFTRADAVSVSATSGHGLTALCQRVVESLAGGEMLADPPLVTNVRHLALLGEARGALLRAREALIADETLSEEFVLADLADARRALEDVTGRRSADDVLAHVFERFCIGK